MVVVARAAFLLLVACAATAAAGCARRQTLRGCTEVQPCRPTAEVAAEAARDLCRDALLSSPADDARARAVAGCYLVAAAGDDASAADDPLRGVILLDAQAAPQRIAACEHDVSRSLRVGRAPVDALRDHVEDPPAYRVELEEPWRSRFPKRSWSLSEGEVLVVLVDGRSIDDLFFRPAAPHDAWLTHFADDGVTVMAGPVRVQPVPCPPVLAAP